jgi:hypothetical protein
MELQNIPPHEDERNYVVMVRPDNYANRGENEGRMRREKC